MDEPNPNPYRPPQTTEPPVVTLIEVIPELVEECAPPQRQPRVWLPVLLFISTCLSTFAAGFLFRFDYTTLQPLSPVTIQAAWLAAIDGLSYSAAVMTILLCHEMGHFLQALRYGVRASLPYFIPMPFSPIGTFGAVIAMEPRQGDRRAIFDIGISGPLAGLIPTLIFLWLGLKWSHHELVGPGAMLFGDPLLVKLVIPWIFGPLPPGHDIVLHPVGFAAWVGLLITSLNLIPIGQLDGGHILYTMLRRKAHVVATILLMAAISASIYLKLTHWWLMLVLLAFMGPRHPPTADDNVPLGFGRYLLGWLTLAFVILGFTPVPIAFPG